MSPTPPRGKFAIFYRDIAAAVGDAQMPVCLVLKNFIGLAAYDQIGGKKTSAPYTQKDND
jgi:hypothetical protein